jgi:hypothetical protein
MPSPRPPRPITRRHFRGAGGRKAVPLPPRARQLIELMVIGHRGSGPLPMEQAAAIMGIKIPTARDYFRRPGAVAYYDQLVTDMRTGERARNVRVAIDIRDDRAMSESAAGNRVRLEAARYIDGEPANGGVTVNVGINNQVSPGYVIDVSSVGPDVAAALAKAGSHANVLDLKAEPPAVLPAHEEEAEEEPPTSQVDPLWGKSTTRLGGR